MGQTAISWTATVLPDGTVLPGYSFNPWIGCTKVSQGCKFCYAETQNNRYQWNQAGWGPGKERKRTSPANWKKPIEWAKQARADGVTRRVFCASLADVFDPEVPQEWRSDLWFMINLTGEYGGLEWLLLTKRPQYIEHMAPVEWLENPPGYVRIGVTTEDQENADRRIPQLGRVWKGKNFVSYEPALGPISFAGLDNEGIYRPWLDVAAWEPAIDWIICGGESGSGCRPFNIEWARSVRDQCARAGIPFFFKQTGGHPNKRHDPAEWPEDLRVQEFPEFDAQQKGAAN